MGCQKKDQDQKTQKKLQKMWAWSVVPMGWWTALGGRGSSAGRLPLLREEAVGTGDRQPPWREPWWWLLLLEGWSWLLPWLLWLPQTGCNGLGTWNGRQTTAVMKHHNGDYQGCPILWWSRFFQTGWEWLSFIHAKNVWCYGEGYFGQKKFAEKVRKSRQNVNRDKSA